MLFWLIDDLESLVKQSFNPDSNALFRAANLAPAILEGFLDAH